MSDSTNESAPGRRSWWQRLTGGLKRTSSSLGSAITDLVTKRKLDAAMLDEIEEVLIRADLGVETAGAHRGGDRARAATTRRSPPTT